jgi:hypothetical protein
MLFQLPLNACAAEGGTEIGPATDCELYDRVTNLGLFCGFLSMYGFGPKATWIRYINAKNYI